MVTLRLQGHFVEILGESVHQLLWCNIQFEMFNLWSYEDIPGFSPANSPWIYPVDNKFSLSIHCWWLHTEPLVRSGTALCFWCATGSLNLWGSALSSALSLSCRLSQEVFKIKDSLLLWTVSTWQIGMSISFRIYEYCQYNLKITIRNFFFVIIPLCLHGEWTLSTGQLV